MQPSTAVKQEVPVSSKKRPKEQCIAPRRTYLKLCTVDDEVFCVGGSAYALEEGQTYRVRSCTHGFTNPEQPNASPSVDGLYWHEMDLTCCVRLQLSGTTAAGRSHEHLQHWRHE